MKKKINLGIIFGGKSVEHEISLCSAKNVVNAIDRKKYRIYLISIDKNGCWRLAKTVSIDKKDPKVFLVPNKNRAKLINLTTRRLVDYIEIIFPVLHGTAGEDGTIQGLLKLCNVPFVGAGILGSAIGMDKEVTKRLLRQAKIPVADFITLVSTQTEDIKNIKWLFEKIKNRFGLPFFIKPADLGSSVGINKVKNFRQFKTALQEAFKYANKILIEKNIEGREIECSVLGNENPIASLPGEVIPTHEFYSYEAKYLDEKGAILKAPVILPKHILKKIQQLAVKAFKILNCEGMARVDFFLKTDGKIYVNEINTIPGFTNISMYPKLWEVSGISQQKLVEKLIQLALERAKRENRLKTSYT